MPEDTPPNEVAELRQENSRLRQKLEEHVESGPALPTQDDELNRLRSENVGLRESLLRYKALEEEVAAQKVFQKAKKMLVTWLTVGGSLLTLVSLLGLLNINDYAKRLVDDKLKEVSEEKIVKGIEDEGRKEVSKLVDKKQADFEEYAHQQIQQYVALIPIGKIPASSSTGSSLPAATISEIDYTSAMNPVRDSGQEGSVVGFALAATMEYQVRRKFGKNLVLSPREIYNLTRQQENTANQDAGALIQDAIKVLAKIGAVPEEAWPYKAGDYAASAPPTVKTAEHYKIAFSRQLSGLAEVKAALQAYGPVVAGISVYDSFETGAVAKTGIVSVPSAGEKIVGGHAICIVGFDDRKRLIKFANSFGPDWGDHGYGYLPYDYVNKNLFSDSWLISL